MVLGIKPRSAVQSTCLTHICLGDGAYLMVLGRGSQSLRLLRGTPEYSLHLAALGNGAHLISVLGEHMGSGV